MSEQVKEKRVKKPKSKARKIIEWVLTGIFLALFAFVLAGQIDGMVHKKEHYNQQLRFGYGTFVVKTDSMEPKYMIGTALITYNEDADKIYERFQKGEEVDITFVDVYNTNNEYTSPLNNPELTKRTDPTGVPMTHRVKEVHVNNNQEKGKGKYTFITAGINTRSTNLGWKEGEPDIVINQYQAFTEKEILGRVTVNSAFLGGVFSFVGSPLGLLVLLLIPAFYLVVSSVIDIFKAYKEPEPATEGAGGPSNNNNGPVTLSEADKKRLKEQLLEEMISKKKGESHESK
jgi:signal peptidase I